MCNDNQDGATIENEYKVGKYVFVVSPVYNESSGKTIHEAILNLMKKDAEKHEKTS